MIEILFPQFKKLFTKIKRLEGEIDNNVGRINSLIIENDRLKTALIDARKALLNYDLPHNTGVALNIIEECIGKSVVPDKPIAPENRLIIEGSFPKSNKYGK